MIDESKPTPGPWCALKWDTLAEAKADGSFRWALDDTFTGPVAMVWQGEGVRNHTGLPGSIEVSLANARLIAASPDLLAACEAAEPLLIWLGTLEQDTPAVASVLDQCRAAITKAKGETP